MDIHRRLHSFGPTLKRWSSLRKHLISQWVADSKPGLLDFYSEFFIFSEVAVGIIPYSLAGCANKREVIDVCWFNVGPPSKTVTQHWTSTVSVCRFTTDKNKTSVQHRPNAGTKLWSRSEIFRIIHHARGTSNRLDRGSNPVSGEYCHS